MKRKVSLKQRLKEPTPRFFKKVIKVTASIGAVGLAILAAPMTFGISIPSTVLTVAGYMAATGAVGASIGKLTSARENDIQ